MTARRRVSLAPAAAIAAAGLSAFLAPISTAADAENPRQLTASSHGSTVPGTLGARCLEEPGPGPVPGATTRVCSDPPYPLATEGQLAVHGGQSVVIDHGARAQEVSAVLKRADAVALGERIPAVPLNESGRRWTVRLPSELPRETAILGIAVRYGPTTDTDWEIALAPHLHRRDSRRILKAASGKAMVPFTASSWCLRPWFSRANEQCRRGRASRRGRPARVHTNRNVRLRLGADATRVLVRVGGSRRTIRADAAHGSARRWTFRLPAGVKPRRSVAVNVTYATRESVRFSATVHTARRAGRRR